MEQMKNDSGLWQDGNGSRAGDTEGIKIYLKVKYTVLGF